MLDKELTLSVVTTLYNSKGTIKEYLDRIVACASQITNKFEIILVDDGSSDGTTDIVKSLNQGQYTLKLFELSRNFGHHAAMLEGLLKAKGDLVFLIDCDLEEEPELLIEFHREMIKSNADVVYGVQKYRSRGKPD